jgi:hypothetical protein
MFDLHEVLSSPKLVVVNLTKYHFVTKLEILVGLHVFVNIDLHDERFPLSAINQFPALNSKIR